MRVIIGVFDNCIANYLATLFFDLSFYNKSLNKLFQSNLFYPLAKLLPKFFP